MNFKPLVSVVERASPSLGNEVRAVDKFFEEILERKTLQLGIGKASPTKEVTISGFRAPETGLLKSSGALREHFFEKVELPGKLFSKTTGEPAAFKVLNGDKSPFDESTVWSLPKQIASDVTKPGEWRSFDGRLRSMVPASLNDERGGLYVTNNPKHWLFSSEVPRVFEAQIGDKASIFKWANRTDDDFPVQKIRLIRALKMDELEQLIALKIKE